MTPEVANRVYDLLEQICRASNSNREDFVWHHSDPASKRDEDHSEYRFQGALGFGGKFYVESIRKHMGQIPWRVATYSECRTNEVDAMIKKVTKALEDLYYKLEAEKVEQQK